MGDRSISNPFSDDNPPNSMDHVRKSVDVFIFLSRVVVLIVFFSLLVFLFSHFSCAFSFILGRITLVQGFFPKYDSQRRTSKYALGILFNNFSRIYIWPITQLFPYLNYYVTVYFFLVFYISTAVTYPRFIYDFSFRYCLPNIGINSFLFLMYQSYLPQYMIDISRG